LVQDVSPHINVTAKPGTPMPFEKLLQEVDQLNSVSERLQLLAGQHPFVDERLLSISGNIRNTATALDVFALIRNQPNGLEKNASKQRYLMWVPQDGIAGAMERLRAAAHNRFVAPATYLYRLCGQLAPSVRKNPI
jgi:hypothetical protein